MQALVTVSLAFWAFLVLGTTSNGQAREVGWAPIQIAEQEAPAVPKTQKASGSENAKGFFDEFVALLKFDQLPRDPTSHLVFAIASGLAGALVFLLDGLACIAGRTRKGLLGVTHGWISLLLVVIWFIGSAIAGVLGYLAPIFDPSPPAALTAGLTWTTFLTQLASFAQRQQQPQQRPPGT